MKPLNRIKNNPWWVAGAVVALAVVWMLSGTTESAAPQTAAEPAQAANTDVRVRHQQAEMIDRYINIYGRTEPARIVTLKAETGGSVASVSVPEGAYAEQGSDLLRLEVRDREAQLERARAEALAAKLTFEAEQKLKHESFASETRLAQAAAQFEAARAELKRIEIDLANTRIKAPFDGALQQRLVEKGDYVAIGDPVATFVEIDTLIISGSVSETDRGKLQVGATATAKLVTGQQASGRVRYIAPVADEATRTFRIEVEVANADRDLPAGVTAELALPAGQVLAHRVSPSILTLDANGEIGIKTVTADNAVRFTNVDIVKSTSDGVWVAGLAPQANIIVVGQGFVRPGETVRPVFEGEPAAPAAVANAVTGSGDAE